MDKAAFCTSPDGSDLARGSSAPPGIFQGTAEGKVTAFPLLLLTRHTLCVLSSVAPVAISWQGRAATRTAGLARPAEAVAQHSEDTTRSTHSLHPQCSPVPGKPWLSAIPNRRFALRLSGLTAAQANAIQEFV